MKVVITSFLCVTLMATFALAGETPRVGAEAPAFELVSDDGKATSLSDLRGKWVVLYFYPKDFTSGCTIEARAFQRDLEQYQTRNAEIVGVSVDSAESHKSFCDKEGLDFLLLSDPEATVSEAYDSVMKGGKLSARNTFIIDPEGRIARVFLSVSPVGHSEEVLSALDGLQGSD